MEIKNTIEVKTTKKQVLVEFKDSDEAYIFEQYIRTKEFEEAKEKWFDKQVII